MVFTINEKCIGCTACKKRCPVDAISGEKKKLHKIDKRLCIECGACGMVCPSEAISNGNGRPLKRLKPNEIPAAVVDINLCSGCGFCSDMCPFGCIEIARQEGQSETIGVAVVNVKKCVACRLCESICIKEAIKMDKRI
ncbi:MAG: hypothetical protein A2149_07765 [Candidatus Schekmanbacteria bacterium RBG_16_38_11]|uniref:4Fe-4S ferredoxin-type domain-containing protein n=3 Tax=Bacteria candidate phyla TaxID=1783234 RepID=A0A1F7RA80_9BACT|nr:MAG: Ferredoxin [Candidatus Gottesmanbacteria bacterium GW2011_GWC2_39_8]OGL38486.1 MAG: hypothetical protein A2042_08755 [Candidatus Schekmanbacteria bacterium GWA2_38_11]OGL44720.1 MAG: hypothetical protein A2149_07765 [Candidatus Schekmanbacteria bacterium RBG_16_38_11]